MSELVLIRKFNIFNHDWEKYILTYDLDEKGINNKKKAYKYFIKKGYKLGHKWFGLNNVKNNRNNNNSIKEANTYKFNFNKQLDSLNLIKYNNKKKEEKINILIRHTYRPKQFKLCIDSILSQNYKNYNIILCYDDIRCKDELKEYDDKIDYFFISEKSKEKYKFNLYCNTLLSKVKDGWIIFLDDDDMFSDNNCLKIINDKLNKENDFVFWKFLRPDKVIFPFSIKHITFGTVANCGYCFNSNYKNKSKWKDMRYGDYIYLKKLLKYSFNRKYIPSILTRTTYNNKISNFGMKESE